MTDFLQSVIATLRIELRDEFDQNFVRKAFFDQPWTARARDGNTDSLLIGSGRLRRSIIARATPTGLTFEGEVYANIHNNGGKIAITDKMRSYFRYKYIQFKESDPALAKYYLNMAITKKTHIEIPQRQFIGDHAVVSQVIDEVVADKIKEIMDYEFTKFNN
ncbi:MAG: phage virion morphogenesis protein [Rikenellaceae bacterium]